MSSSPWGQIQESQSFAPGFRSVSTAGHGGYMLTEKFAKSHLSKEALELADIYEEGKYVQTLRRFYCYEEDCDWAIPALELLDTLGNKMFANAGADYATNEQRREYIIRVLSGYQPDFLISKGIQPDEESWKRYKSWKENEKLRSEKCPDLITSALGIGEVCTVTTADGKTHFVNTASYDNARKEGYWVTRLSSCILADE